ncbi:MAG TPA: phosphoribosyltransferase family protein [Gemmatimonadales bacterium]|nr:phosphoribosyltransferase family protein [Gemmatimonadales bacterium]
MTPLFGDRRDAGRQLARRLSHLAGRDRLLVLGLPRGGVPVAYEVATALGAPLDVFVVRKLGVPGHEELAMGAVASGGVRVLNHATIDALGIPQEAIERVTAAELRELARREREYRRGRPFPDLRGATVVLVDDGVATGSSMLAAVQALHQHRPGAVIVAAPVVSLTARAALAQAADACEYVAAPEPFFGVGAWYHNFEQTSDEEVRALLDAAQGPAAEERYARHA